MTLHDCLFAIVDHDARQYDELLTNIEFDAPDTATKLNEMSESVKNEILDQVEKDLSRVLPTLTENVYGFGKQVARLANLAKIAHNFHSQLNRQLSDDDKNTTTVQDNIHRTRIEALATQSTSSLYHYLVAFLDGKNSDNLLYDTNFGGVITRDGLMNSQADFGNGWYNDHHFHYGYILYASAIMGNINSTFINEFGTHVDSLLHDVAYNRNQVSVDVEGSFFPFTRHKSWFDGHSFASGLFPFADGKSQESSSEAVNCYYGAYLWSLVSARNNQVTKLISQTHAVDQVKWMKLLLAMEIRSTKTYWHMVPSSEAIDMGNFHSNPTFNPQFEKTLMVGNLGMMDVTVSTWFGPQELYVHMINFMPVTAITKELFDPGYVKLEFQDVLGPVYDSVEMAWKGYVIADKAIIDPKSAWKDAQNVRSSELDSALSQSQLYFWISTMDEFEMPSMNATYTNRSSTNDEGNVSFCSGYEACINAGMTGKCCPTNEGVILGCCYLSMHEVKNETVVQQVKNETNVTVSTTNSSCDQNAVCASSGLTGSCCPTHEGIMLGCCNT